MRFTFLLALAAITLGCKSEEPDDGSPKGDTSGIVFGITQRTDPATGRTTTIAGHEYLFLGWDKWSSGPWAAGVQSLPAGWCARLESARTIERANVGDGGRARFSGGALPASGLVIDANGSDPSFGGTAFEPSRPMTFAIESGFALPPFAPIEVSVPNASLRMTAPADPGDLRVEGGGDLRLAWSSTDPDANVFVVFRPDDGGQLLRCFFREGDGGAVVRASDLEGLGRGTFSVASHRQKVVTPGAGWLVEVFAAAIVDERRYVID